MTTAPRTVLFCLHGLGLSSRLYDRVAAELGPESGVELVAFDSPGFGDAPAPADSMFEAAIAHAEDRIRTTLGGADRPWAIAGHSYGGKVATMVADRARRGENGLEAPAAVAMIASSPPSPEPMSDDGRAQMLGWASGPRIAEDDARTFVDQNTAGPLDAGRMEVALGDVQRSAPSAWRSWLTDGSLQDRSPGLQPFDLPAVVLAGGSDDALGADAQRSLVLPFYPRAELSVVDGAAHFVPLERPDAVARAFAELIGATARA